MEQVIVRSPGVARVEDVPEPDPGARDAVVRVAACGICGSDLSYIKMGGIPGAAAPMRLGHEIAGVVEWVGRDVRGVSVGDRVVVHPGIGEDDLGVIGNGGPEGGLTRSLLVYDAARGGRLFQVPAGLPLEVAAMTEAIAVGMHAVDRSDATLGDRVAVFGCGPIGLAAIATCVDRGIEVVGVDLSRRRLELAAEIGARAVLSPKDDDVWGELARLHGAARSRFGATPATEVFIEASGSAEVLTDIVSHAPVDGRVSVPAVHYEPVPTSFLMIMAKQLHIRGSMGYPERFEDALELLARRDLSPLITHRVPLDRFADALAVLDGDRNCGKVIVTMPADDSVPISTVSSSSTRRPS